jgi:hypothetical protein
MNTLEIFDIYNLSKQEIQLTLTNWFAVNADVG